MRRDYEKLALPALLILVVVLFTLAPIAAIDWYVYRGAAGAVLSGSPYGSGYIDDGYFYYNPPWLAIVLVPLSVLPFKLSYAIAMTTSLIIAMALLYRWQASFHLLKSSMVLLSPFMFYLLWNGQVDLLVLGVLLLPGALRWVGAFTKPQITAGLIFAGHWRVAIPVFVLVLAMSLLLWPGWVNDWMSQPSMGWRSIFLFTLPIGAILIGAGLYRSNERLLVIGAPLCFPYVQPHSYIGAWIALLSCLPGWAGVPLNVAAWVIVFLSLCS